MPTPRTFLAAASPWSATIFAIGGKVTYLPTVKVYNPFLDTWEGKASMFTPREDLAVAVANDGSGDKVYAIGGFNGKYLPTVEAYDPVTDSWTPKAPMPTPRANLAVAVADPGSGDKIYAIGGYDGTDLLPTVEEYDPVLNTWTAKTDLIVAPAGPPQLVQMMSHAAEVLAGKVYVFGGNVIVGGTGPTPGPGVFKYDPVTDSWGVVIVDSSYLLTPRLNLASAVVADKIYAIGGFSDTKYMSTVERYEPAGIITTLAGNGTSGPAGDGGPATLAQLNDPYGVAIDSAGNVYIADVLNHRIRKVDTAGNITTVAGDGTGTPGFSGDTGPATSAQLDTPSGVAVDGAGNLYIADKLNHRIRKVDAVTGTITTVAGDGTPAYGGDGGPAILAQLNEPVRVAVDSAGNLYIAELGNHVIRKVDTAGDIDTVAGDGTPGFSGDGGPATSAQLDSPIGVAVDGAGNLYIADKLNQRVRKVDTAGDIGTVAGDGTPGFSGDGGPATSAQLDTPSGVAVDGAGNLYIADKLNHRIRKVDTAGDISTVAGDGTPAYGGDGGAATSAQLSSPTGVTVVTVDGSDDVYIADSANQRIRKVIGVNLSSPRWTSIVDAGTPRTRLAAGAIGGKIYAVGGTNGLPLSATERYDPVTGAWTATASMPEKIEGMGVAVADPGSGDKIYAIGGSAVDLSANERYDSVGDIWSSAAPMPTPRWGLVAAAPSNRMVYAIGGTTGWQDLVVNEEYNPTEDTWASKAPLLSQRRFMTGAAVGGTVYVIGGLRVAVEVGGSATVLSTNEAYDPFTDSWSPVAPMPTPRFLASAVEVNGKIYVTGGVTVLLGGPSDNNVVVIYLDTVEIYDPAADSWSTGTPLPTPRASAGAAFPGYNMLYVTGGFNASGALATTERYNLLLDRWDPQASLNVPALPLTGRHALAVVSPQSSSALLAMGGEHTDVATYNKAGKWQTSGTVYRATERYVRGATFATALTVSPTTAELESVVTVALQVTNVGDAPDIAVSPDLVINAGSTWLTLPVGPVPSGPVAMALGEMASFVWTYTVTGCGTVSWSATVMGASGTPVLAWTNPPLTTVFPSILESSLAAFPLPLRADNLVTVTFTVTNTSSTVDAPNVTASLVAEEGASLITLVSGPVPADPLLLAKASTVTFTWTYSVAGAGFVRFGATAADPACGTLSSATKSTGPSAPQGLKAVQGDAQVSLTWDANPASELIMSYEIYRSATPGVPLVAMNLVGTVTGAVFEYVDQGLDNGQVYWYQVAAVNADGRGLAAEVQGLPLQLPGIEGDVRITSTGARPLVTNIGRGERVQILINVPQENVAWGLLKLTVYTLAGEEVRVVVHASAVPGPQIFEWDGRNDQGNLVASGGYILVVNFPDGRRVVRKIAIVK